MLTDNIDKDLDDMPSPEQHQITQNADENLLSMAERLTDRPADNESSNQELVIDQPFTLSEKQFLQNQTGFLQALVLWVSLVILLVTLPLLMFTFTWTLVVFTTIGCAGILFAWWRTKRYWQISDNFTDRFADLTRVRITGEVKQVTIGRGQNAYVEWRIGSQKFKGPSVWLERLRLNHVHTLEFARYRSDDELTYYLLAAPGQFRVSDAPKQLLYVQRQDLAFITGASLIAGFFLSVTVVLMALGMRDIDSEKMFAWLPFVSLAIGLTSIGALFYLLRQHAKHKIIARILGWPNLTRPTYAIAQGTVVKVNMLRKLYLLAIEEKYAEVWLDPAQENSQKSSVKIADNTPILVPKSMVHKRLLEPGQTMVLVYEDGYERRAQAVYDPEMGHVREGKVSKWYSNLVILLAIFGTFTVPMGVGVRHDMPGLAIIMFVFFFIVCSYVVYRLVHSFPAKAARLLLKHQKYQST